MVEESDAARLLSLYSSKPPKARLTAEERKRLHPIVNGKDMKLLFDYTKIKAWQRMIPLMQLDPTQPDFAVKFAEQKGFRDGMLCAIEQLQMAVEEPDDGE